MIIGVNDDFDIVKIAQSGQCFRAVCCPDGRVSFITGEHKVRMTDLGDGRFDVDCERDEWDAVWHRYFNLDRSYRGLAASIDPEDTFMREAAAFSRGIRILRQDPWETLVSFIISQRKSIPAIKQSVEALCTGWGKKCGSFRAFPSPQALMGADLSQCKLGYREPYIEDTVRCVSEGEVDLEALGSLKDDELMTALMSIKGVGIKVASCVALFAYARTGVAPIDTWMQKIIDRQYNGVNVFTGKDAGILQQYAFYHALKHKEMYKEDRP